MTLSFFPIRLHTQLQPSLASFSMDQPEDLAPAFHARSYSHLPTPQRSAKPLSSLFFSQPRFPIWRSFNQLFYSPNNISRYVNDLPHTPQSPLPNAYAFFNSRHYSSPQLFFSQAAIPQFFSCIVLSKTPFSKQVPIFSFSHFLFILNYVIGPLRTLLPGAKGQSNV